MAEGMNRKGKELSDRISNSLKELFEGVARTALQGADEASSESLDVLKKLRKSHTRVSTIIEDSMRGLADAHEELFISGIINAVSSDDDEEDTEESSPR